MRFCSALYHNSKLFGQACLCVSLFYSIALGKERAERILSGDYHTETISVGFSSIAQKRNMVFALANQKQWILYTYIIAAIGSECLLIA